MGIENNYTRGVADNCTRHLEDASELS